MKDRRGFLKLLGIGAGAVAAGVLAVVAGSPAPAPRTIQDIEVPKPYIGPDSVPQGDYIKERPKVVPNLPLVPDPTPEQPQWITRNDIDLDVTDWNIYPGKLIPTVDPGIQLMTYTTSGTTVETS